MFKNFYIKDLFEVINNPQLDKENFTFSESAEYPYFTRTENNNGILGYVEYLDEEHKIKGNSLAVGMISMRFHYMYHDFYAGQFTKTLIPKFQGFNEKLAMYFMAILNKHSEYYQSFLVRDFKDKVSETVVSLPVVESPDLDHEYTVEDIDFNYIQERIAELEQEHIAELEQEHTAELNAYLVASGLDDYELTAEDKKILALSPESASYKASTSEAVCEDGQARFKEFEADELFEIRKGKRLTKADMKPGDINFIGSSSSNNGVTAKIGNTEHLHPAHTITVSYNGSVGEVFLQDEPFWASDDVNVWYPKIKVDELALLYIMTLIKKLSAKYNYTAKWTIDKMRAEKLSLPIIESPEPDHDYTVEDIDFDYMKRYIRAIEKLAIADVVRHKDKLITTTRQVVGV